MKNIVLTLSYEGLNFLGYQKNKAGPSIEEALEKALFQILQEKPILQAASRTDKGVNAFNQIVNFYCRKDLDLKKMLFSLNQLLPKEIRVRKICTKPLNFHPTLSAKAKEYHYFISNNAAPDPYASYYSWHVPFLLDLSLMKQGAQKLIGVHDFLGFSNQKPSKKDIKTIKTIFDIAITKKNGLITIKIKGDNFLYKMARNIVGTLVYVGCSKLPLPIMDEILVKKDRKMAGLTAPACGLFLYKIYY